MKRLWRSLVYAMVLAASCGSALGASADRSISDLRLKLIWIKPGTFAMGAQSDDVPNRQPVTQVTITQGFWLGQTEVTQAQWTAVMGNNPSSDLGADLPVEQMSWNEARDFCRKLTERERAAGRLAADLIFTLPTEAQWEYACRAGTTGDHAGNVAAMAWSLENAGDRTHPVGQKRANTWGLHDMHGNVWEWCLDWHGSPPVGAARAAPGTGRVTRGGCFGLDAPLCRSATRNWQEPDASSGAVGFRLALVLSSR